MVISKAEWLKGNMGGQKERHKLQLRKAYDSHEEHYLSAAVILVHAWHVDRNLPCLCYARCTRAPVIPTSGHGIGVSHGVTEWAGKVRLQSLTRGVRGQARKSLRKKAREMRRKHSYSCSSDGRKGHLDPSICSLEAIV